VVRQSLFLLFRCKLSGTWSDTPCVDVSHRLETLTVCSPRLRTLSTFQPTLVNYRWHTSSVLVESTSSLTVKRLLWCPNRLDYYNMTSSTTTWISPDSEQYVGDRKVYRFNKTLPLLDGLHLKRVYRYIYIYWCCRVPQRAPVIHQAAPLLMPWYSMMIQIP